MPITVTVTAADGAVGTIPAPSPIIIAPSSGLTAAVVTLSTGQAVTYDPATGTDLGNYTDPQGRFGPQRCIKVTSPAVPYLVALFRPDMDGSRDEIVFEYGDIWASTAPDLLNYTADIYKGGVKIRTYTVARQWFHSRWRHKSSDRAPMPYSNVKALVQKGWLPPYSSALGKGLAPKPAAQVYAGPMSLGGIYPNMQTTGERYDIGPLPEPYAYYLGSGDATALASVMAWAEGSGSIQWHFRDRNTNAPVDLNLNPKLTWYNPTPGGQIGIPRPANTGVTPDPTHEPQLAALPFMLRGDLWDLEELQAASTFNLLAVPSNSRQVFTLQLSTRSLAWTIRTLALCWLLSPPAASCPVYLKPQEYWKALLDAARDYMLETFVNSGAAPFATFSNVDLAYGSQGGQGSIPAQCYSDPWQQSFAGFITCWIAMIDPTWLPVATWKMQNTIARTNGTSGWMRERCAPYNMALRASTTAAWAASWGDAWSLNESLQPTFLTIPVPGALTILKAGDMTYPGYDWGALAMATILGIPGAKACYDWLTGQLQANMKAGYWVANKWLVADALPA